MIPTEIRSARQEIREQIRELRANDTGSHHARIEALREELEQLKEEELRSESMDDLLEDFDDE